MSSLTWNPFIGNFQIPFDPNTIAQFGFTATCDPDLDVGSPVVVSETVDEKVEGLTDNNYGKRRVVGIVYSKPSPTATTCFVAEFGTIEITGASFTRSEPVWVSTTGGLTSTAPSSGDIQSVGVALSATKIRLNIDPRKLVKS